MKPTAPSQGTGHRGHPRAMKRRGWPSRRWRRSGGAGDPGSGACAAPRRGRAAAALEVGAGEEAAGQATAVPGGPGNPGIAGSAETPVNSTEGPPRAQGPLPVPWRPRPALLPSPEAGSAPGDTQVEAMDLPGSPEAVRARGFRCVWPWLWLWGAALPCRLHPETPGGGRGLLRQGWQLAQDLKLGGQERAGRRLRGGGDKPTAAFSGGCPLRLGRARAAPWARWPTRLAARTRAVLPQWLGPPCRARGGLSQCVPSPCTRQVLTASSYRRTRRPREDRHGA